jgi:hypothetical protein
MSDESEYYSFYAGKIRHWLLDDVLGYELMIDLVRKKLSYCASSLHMLSFFLKNHHIIMFIFYVKTWWTLNMLLWHCELLLSCCSCWRLKVLVSQNFSSCVDVRGCVEVIYINYFIVLIYSILTRNDRLNMTSLLSLI